METAIGYGSVIAAQKNKHQLKMSGMGKSFPADVMRWNKEHRMVNAILEPILFGAG
jgi:hypothetical protein